MKIHKCNEIPNHVTYRYERVSGEPKKYKWGLHVSYTAFEETINFTVYNVKYCIGCGIKLDVE